MRFPIKKLGDLVEILSGYAFDSQFFNENVGQKLIRIRDIMTSNTKTYYSGQFEEKYLVNKGDMLISMDGEFNIAKWEAEPALLNQRVCKIDVIDKSLDKNYLFYFLPLQLKIIEDVTPFVTVKHLSVKKINNIKIPLPPLAEQRKIVNQLTISSNLINKRKQTIEIMDKLSQSIFSKMYDNLDDTSMCLLGDVINIKRGGSPRPITKWLTDKNDGVNWIKISDASKSDKYIYSTEQKIKKEGIKMSRYVKNGDFILSNSMSYGRPYILKTDGCIHDGWLLLSDEKKVFEQDFLYSLLCSTSVNHQFKSSATGAVVKNLNINAVRKIKIKLPTKRIQQKFTQEIKKIEDKKALYIKQLSKFRDLHLSLNNQIFAEK